MCRARFTGSSASSQDSLFGNLTLRDDLNLYAYVDNELTDKTDSSGTEAATADWLQQTQALNAATPVSGDELQSFILDSLPVVGEYRSISAFVDDPSLLGAGVILALAVDLGGVAKAVGKEGIVYQRINRANPAEKPYIGRAKSEERFEARQGEHGRANPDADYDY